LGDFRFIVRLCLQPRGCKKPNTALLTCCAIHLEVEFLLAAGGTEGMQIRKVAAVFHCTETALEKPRRYQGREVVKWTGQLVRIRDVSRGGI